MRAIHLVNVSLGLVLGSTLLLGCGASETSEPNATETDSAIVPERDPNLAESSDPTDSSSTDPAETLINPPKSATLTAQDPNAEINLRSQPTTDATSAGYGLVGDSIALLKAAEGDDGLTWYYVKFDESKAEGWIRGDFINTTGATTRTKPDRTATNPMNSFTTDELFAVGSGGCGMTLWPINDPGQFIFFNGLPDTGMWMKLGDDMTQFRRTAASGPEFYGQSASQTFQSVDGGTTVNVTVGVGSEVGYESVTIEQGTLRLDYAGETIELLVAGDAGC